MTDTPAVRAALDALQETLDDCAWVVVKALTEMGEPTGLPDIVRVRRAQAALLRARLNHEDLASAEAELVAAFRAMERIRRKAFVSVSFSTAVPDDADVADVVAGVAKVCAAVDREETA